MSKIYDKILKCRRNYKIHVEEFNSAMEVAETCKNRSRTSTSFHDTPNERMRTSWHGVENYDEALDLLRNGYEPQVTMAEIKRIANGTDKRISFVNDIVGFTPVVPLALSGVPNCMVNTRMRPMKNKVVSIYYDMTHSCGVTPEDIIDDGKKILGAIMAIESKGYRVNLFAVQTYSDESSTDMLVVKVKSSDRPFDLKRMSFPTMHTAFFRVIGFDWYSKVPNGTYRCGYGHSFGRELEGKTKDAIRETFGDGAIYLCDTILRKETKESLESVLSGSESDCT